VSRPSRNLLAAMLTLILAACLLPGCALSGNKMSSTTASTLQRDVDAVVTAADASRWSAAIDALDQLEADVATAQAAGELSDERAAQIRAVQERVLQDLQQIRRSSPTPRAATTPQTTPSTKASDNGGNNGNGDNGQNSKSKEDDQGENGRSGKSKDDDQGEDGGGKHKGQNKG
jgi:hypothetical protein